MGRGRHGDRSSSFGEGSTATTRRDATRLRKWNGREGKGVETLLAGREKEERVCPASQRKPSLSSIPSREGSPRHEIETRPTQLPPPSSALRPSLLPDHRHPSRRSVGVAWTSRHRRMEKRSMPRARTLTGQLPCLPIYLPYPTSIARSTTNCDKRPPPVSLPCLHHLLAPVLICHPRRAHRTHQVQTSPSLPSPPSASSDATPPMPYGLIHSPAACTYTHALSRAMSTPRAVMVLTRARVASAAAKGPRSGCWAR